MDWNSFREPVSAWTHFVWMVLALPATVWLWHLARGNRLKQVGVAVFGLSMVACYGGSWLYHSVPSDLIPPFATLDHIGIYLLIAGTTTPIALVVLRGRWRVGLLAGIWSLAALGIALRLAWDLPIGVLTVFYLFMGWIGCAMYFELARVLGHAGVRPIWIGGLFYSVGAILNGLDWPVIVPGVFEAHELFHLFVMTGTGWHYYFMLSHVVPARS